MKANELRVGNYIVSRNGEVKKVENIQKNSFNQIIDSDDVSGSYLLSHYSGIPLSPEILEKFDFAERYNSGVSSNKDHFILLINGTRFYFRPSYQGGFYWGIVDKDIDNSHEPNDCIPLQSLHQFQNWYFIMAGEELNYKQ